MRIEWKAFSGLLLTVLVALLPSSGMALCSYFNFELHPEQVVPQSQTSGFGGSELLVCEDNMLSGYVTIDVSEVVTGIHVHGPADTGEVGQLLHVLPLPVNGTTSISIGPLPATQLEWLVLSMLYVDVHSDIHPDGVIRGQVHAEIAVEETPWSTIKRLYR